MPNNLLNVFFFYSGFFYYTTGGTTGLVATPLLFRGLLLIGVCGGFVFGENQSISFLAVVF